MASHKIMHPDTTIPWIDMQLFMSGTPQQKIETGMAFGNAMRELGFVAVSNIGLSKKTIDDAYAMSEYFFEKPDDFKMQTRAPEGHHGFLPFGTEHAKYTDILDLKEFFQTTGSTHPENLWPAIPGFREAITALYVELENCMKACLQAIAISLGYTAEKEQTILSDMLGTGNGLMRLLHYPPVGPLKSPLGAVRSAAHEDLSMMTVIPRATASGLQVLTRHQEWLDVVVPDNAAIINAADTLQYITNGFIPSTTHRVVNPPVHDHSHRYSIPFFASLPFATPLRVLEKCKGNTPPENLPKEITFGEFLTQRYQAIGLK